MADTARLIEVFVRRGIIPDADRAALSAAGVAAIYTPKDYAMSRIMREVAELAVAHRS
jgi:(2R)-ethylmalonyl-CoA mutase